MEKETLNCILLNRAAADGKPAVRRNLRLEVLDLRQRLKACQEAASRHAVMLREGDHRIKNSLQIVASLMTLQAGRETSASVCNALESAAGRVRAIGGIHDALQGSIGVDTVDLGAVLSTMCASLQTMASDEGHISIIAKAEPLQVPVALAQPLALAVNELIVNALRHAFPGMNAGVVLVSLAHTDDDMSVTVADDGVGLPDGYAVGRGYGMQLVAMITKQVGGELRVEREDGAEFTIRVPLVAPLGGKPVAAVL